MNWFDCLEAFRNVAENNSFNASARALKTSTPVITKRIQWLEQELETTLFTRTTRKISLTETGEILFKQIKPLLSEWESIKLELVDFKSEPQGNLSICLPPDLGGIDMFSNIFFEFSKKYPKIHLQIKITDKPIRLMEENVDVLIAPEKYILEPQTTIGIKLFNYNYKLYASPSYLKQFGTLESPQDLSRHNCLVYAEDKVWQIGKEEYHVSGNCQGYSGSCLIKLAVLGHGILRIPDFMIQHELQHGLLKEILPLNNNKNYQLSIFYTKHKYDPKKIKLLVNLIQSHLKK